MKNRYGSTDEVGVFEMRDDGMHVRRRGGGGRGDGGGQMWWAGWVSLSPHRQTPPSPGPPLMRQSVQDLRASSTSLCSSLCSKRIGCKWQPTRRWLTLLLLSRRAPPLPLSHCRWCPTPRPSSCLTATWRPMSARRWRVRCGAGRGGVDRLAGGLAGDGGGGGHGPRASIHLPAACWSERVAPSVTALTAGLRPVRRLTALLLLLVRPPLPHPTTALPLGGTQWCWRARGRC